MWNRNIRGAFVGAWTGPFVLGALGIAGYVFAGSTRASSPLFVAVTVLALGSALWSRSLARPIERVAWFTAAFALFLFVAGEAVWLLSPSARFLPFPSEADGLFFAACLPLGIGAIALAAAAGREKGRSDWFEAAILTAVGTLLAWQTLIQPRLDDPTIHGAARVDAILHPLADVLLLGLVVRLLLNRNARDRASLVFAAGAALLLVADLVRIQSGTAESFRPGGGPGAFWITGYLLIGAAGLVPAGGRARSRGRGAMTELRLSVVVAAVFVPSALVMRELAHRSLLGTNTLTFAAATAVAVLILAAVGLRQLFSATRLAEAHRGEARLSALILHSADAILLVDVDHRISFASPSVEELAGMPADSLLGGSLLDCFSDESAEAVRRQLENLAALPAGTSVPLEGSVHAEKGQVRMVEGVGRNLLDDENVRAVVVTLRDTTARRELEQQLERRAFHDDLTGLANRALFADRLAHAIKRKARDHEMGMAILFIDLDDFKAVNDGMGHEAGDALLRGVAERIMANIRPGDTVARLGGDEFAVLVEDTPSPNDVTLLAGRLIEMLALPINVMGVAMAVPASVGITYATHESTVDSLLRDADIAMYSAKSQGKGRVEVFDSVLRDVAVRRLELRVELPQALRTNQFRVVYQPIKNVADERLCGFEALIRWDHPERGLISPAEFIPAAEETGIIVDLGRFVLGEAARQTAEWNRRQAEPLSIAVNVSGLQLHEPNFLEDVKRTLELTGLAPNCLTIELTESVLIKNQRVEAILLELRELGLGIAIDDFGTGYSSLSYLREFPATSVKIDRAFVSALGDHGDVGLVRSIVAIGHALGLTTVAEGVETVEQLAVIRELGCERAQGFLFGRPQTAAEIEGMLEIVRMQRSAEQPRGTVVPLRSR